MDPGDVDVINTAVSWSHESFDPIMTCRSAAKLSKKLAFHFYLIHRYITSPPSIPS